MTLGGRYTGRKASRTRERATGTARPTAVYTGNWYISQSGGLIGRTAGDAANRGGISRVWDGDMTTLTNGFHTDKRTTGAVDN